ncbi:MAG: septal ring lytic transglycosylase RlpA family protein [Desulfuromonadaceae bacterium]|nr:septal ring lytic transglycosylase RlpA family protein [Desulfuromonadaceae bacterium]
MLRNRCFVILVLCLFCGACGAPQYSSRVLHNPTNQHLKGHQKPYKVNGERYVPLLDHTGFVDEGRASWYGKDFHGKQTSNGETYDMHAMTAAHKTLPLGVFVRVKNLDNGKETVVRVNDRGPFVVGRIIDLSYAAARQLDVVGPGTAPVRIEALGYQIKGASGKVSYQQPKSYDSGVFAVQVGAFSVEANARRLADDLGRRYGHSGLRRGVVNGKTFFRVHAGKYESLEEAQSALMEFAIDGFEGFVVAVD